MTEARVVHGKRTCIPVAGGKGFLDLTGRWLSVNLLWTSLGAAELQFTGFMSFCTTVRQDIVEDSMHLQWSIPRWPPACAPLRFYAVAAESPVEAGIVVEGP